MSALVWLQLALYREALTLQPSSAMATIRLFSLLFVLTALSAVCCGQVRAQVPDPPYLVEFPSVDLVLAQVKGRNERDTAARQMGAFYHLRDMIERLSDGRVYANKLKPDEQRLMTAYGEARGAISRRIEAALTQNYREDWFIARGRFETSDDYRDEVLNTFFSKPWVDAYLDRTFAEDQQQRRVTEGRYGRGWSAIAFSLPAAVRDSLLNQLAIAVLLLGFAIWRETRPFGVDASDPDLLRSGLRGRYRISTLRGRAANVKNRIYKTRTTRTDSDGQVSISDTTEYTVSFTLDGGDRSVEVPESNVHLSIEEGTNMSAAWVSRPRAAHGSYLLLMQHDSGAWHTYDDTLRRHMKAWLWPALPLAWLVLTMFNLSRYSEGGESVLGIMGVVIGAVLIGYCWWRSKTTSRRIARYYATAGEALRERLTAQSLDLQAADGRKQQVIRARQERRREK